jgi:hypothetical protein
MRLSDKCCYKPFYTDFGTTAAKYLSNAKYKSFIDSKFDPQFKPLRISETIKYAFIKSKLNPKFTSL